MKQLRTLCAAAVVVSSLASAQEVTLPLERYEELRARSRPVAQDSVIPAAPFALEAAQLEITAGRGSARVSQRLTLSIYAEDWVRVPLAASGSLTSTQLGTLDGRVDTRGGIALVVRGRGRHVVRVESVVPLVDDETATRATRNGSLPLPAAALVTGSLVTAADVEEAEIVSGGLATAAAAPHRYEFAGIPGATLFFQMRGAGRQAAARPRQPVRVEAQAFTLARIARTRSRLEARAVFEVANGEADGFMLQLPAGFDVVSLAPAAVGWVQEGSTLKITPPAPVDATLSVDVVLTGDPQSAFAAPFVVPAGVARVRLLSAVHVEADGIPEMTDPGSSRRAEPAETAMLPTAAARLGVPVFVVREPKRPPRWVVTWSETAALLPAQIDRLLVNALLGASGQAAYQMWADVRSSGSTDVVIAPPAGFELVSVERDGVPVMPGSGEKGLVIPLGAGSGVQRIHLSGLLSSLPLPEEGELTLPMPSSTVPFGQVEVALRLPGDRLYTLVNPERSGQILGLTGAAPPVPPPSKKGGAAVDLSALVATGGGASVRPEAYFAAPGNSALVLARWSALTGNLGPLGIRVKPRREKEEWF